MPNRIAPSKLLAEFVGTFALAPVPPPWRELDLPFGRDNERIEQRAQYNLDFACTIARAAILMCRGRAFHSYWSGQIIASRPPGPARIARRKPCSFTIAATRFRPRPTPGVFRILSER
jgi:hypothetical protein